MKKVFLKDIAENLNISKTTVSLVLNNKGDENKISKETQKKVIDYAKAHNYKPNELARGLSSGKSETIGLIIPTISDTFYARIASCLEKKARQYGYTVIFSSSKEIPKKEAELIRSMLNRQVEGLIIASTQQNKEEIAALKKTKIPFVLFDRHYPNCKTNYVVVDNFAGAKVATEHLLNLKRRRIGFVTLKPGLEVMRQRLLGYQSALNNHNIDLKQNLVKELSINQFQSEMAQTIRELILFPNSVDAILFSTHYLTVLGLRELRKLNIRVPQDVAIVSFDELSTFDLVHPPITSVVQPVDEIGDLVMDVLMNRIKSRKSLPLDQKILDTKLTIRKSCGTI